MRNHSFRSVWAATAGSFLCLLVPVIGGPSLTCTLSARDEPSCLSSVDDSGASCVWCNVASFGFCLDEPGAEAVESLFPNAQCDRNDGPTPSTDDSIPTDDVTPPAPPSPTPAPDIFWKCLTYKTHKDCPQSTCTWCDTKGGFGLCLADPAAESAKHSDWFSCDEASEEEDVVQKKIIDDDTSCIDAYVKHTSETGCLQAVDHHGRTCAYCSLAGMSHVCLTIDQAHSTAYRPLGIKCHQEDTNEWGTDPSDKSCILAYLIDPTESGCSSAVDEDGSPCEWCTYQGLGNVCLTSIQAQMAASLGVTCDASSSKDDPADISCMRAFLTEPSQDGCTSAVDEDGAACDWCTYPGLGNLCLTQTQASIAVALGVDCEPKSATRLGAARAVQDDPTDTSCMLAFLTDPTPEGCTSAVDEDGAACDWCSYPGLGNLCLTQTQANIAQALGVACAATSTRTIQADRKVQDDPSGTSCMLAFLADPTPGVCKSAVDEDGAACDWCSYPGLGYLCLTQTQANIWHALGAACDTASIEHVQDDPSDTSCMLAFFTDPSQEGCTSAVDEDGLACDWCTYPGIGNLCLTQTQANIAEALGVTCDDESNKNVKVDAAVQDDPSDTSCILAFLSDPTQEGCTSAVDEDGLACDWCTYPGLGNLCLTQTQANIAQALGVACDAESIAALHLDRDVQDDPSDTSCILAFLTDPTQEGCTSAVDEDGAACDWCIYPGLGNLCLTQTQANIAEALGVSCDAASTKADRTVQDDPSDTSCILAYLSDPTADGCVATVDADGAACEWCMYPGVGSLCLTEAQANIAQALGVSCSADPLKRPSLTDDPSDTSCILAFLTDPTQEGCTSAVDEDGTPCDWCTYPGMGNLCLTQTQANIAQAIGVECDASKQAVEVRGDPTPMDPSCMIGFLADMTKETCESTSDINGSSCEFCTNGLLKACFTTLQAKYAALVYDMKCEDPVRKIHSEEDGSLVREDVYDESCLRAFFLGDQTEKSCTAALDEDGQPCQWCHLSGLKDICLTATQGDLATQIGVWCDGDLAPVQENSIVATTGSEKVTLPDDFFDCLENYDEEGCGQSSCTWCDTDVGMGFCTSDAVARAFAECTFFQCNYKRSQSEMMAESTTATPLDPLCLTASMNNNDPPQDACNSTTDSTGNPCVWCDGAGVFGLCLSTEQAIAAGKYLQCDSHGAGTIQAL
jgi:hypothetical protein